MYSVLTPPVFRRLLFPAAWLILLLSAPAAWAEEPSQTPFSTPLDHHIDTAHRHLSDMVSETAVQIDNFFLDERVLDEDNQTRLIFRPGLSWEDDTGLKSFARFSLRLRLPKIEKRFNLFFSSAIEEESDAEQTPLDPPDTLPGDRDENGLNAALQYLLKSGEDKNIRFQAGGRLSGEPQVYAGYRFRYYTTVGEHGLRFVQSGRYFTEDLWDFRATMDVDHKYSDAYLARFTTDVAWYEKGDDGFPHGVSLSLYHTPTPRRGYQYQLAQYFVTEPSWRDTEGVFRIRYRQRLWRDWFVFEISPQVTFPRDKDYEPNPGIVTRCEIAFGYQGGDKGLF